MYIYGRHIVYLLSKVLILVKRKRSLLFIINYIPHNSTWDRSIFLNETFFTEIFEGKDL